MTQYIDKSALVAEILKRIKKLTNEFQESETTQFSIIGQIYALENLISFLDTLEVIDPYEQIVQHDSIKSGIQAHAEIYSFNIESELFNQLTKEQQALWRKEIEQACISGGEVGVELARDSRYKENVEGKEIGLGDNVKETLAQKQSKFCEKCMNTLINSKERASILTECRSQSCWYKGY